MSHVFGRYLPVRNPWSKLRGDGCRITFPVAPNLKNIFSAKFDRADYLV